MIGEGPGIQDGRLYISVRIGFPAALTAHTRGPGQPPVIVAPEKIIHTTAVIEKHVADHRQSRLPDRCSLGLSRRVVRTYPRTEEHRIRITRPDGVDHPVDRCMGEFDCLCRVLLGPHLLRRQPYPVQMIRAERLTV